MDVVLTRNHLRTLDDVLTGKCSSLAIGLAILWICGCSGETAPSCRFSLNDEPAFKKCSGTVCSCRLPLDVDNFGAFALAGVIRYEALDKDGIAFAHTDFRIDLPVGAKTHLESDFIRNSDNKFLEDCSDVSSVRLAEPQPDDPCP